MKPSIRNIIKIQALGALLGLSAAHSAFACVGKGDLKICPGNLVFKGSEYAQGAIVKGINPFKNTVTVQSINNGSLQEENISDLFLSRGCIGSVCVGQKVYKGDEYSQGARVRGLNLNRRSATVQSIRNGSMLEEEITELDVVRGCLEGVCVQDIVYKGDEYSQGARVAAINFSSRTVTVQSIRNQGLFVEDPRELAITDQCQDYDHQTRRNSLSRH